MNTEKLNGLIINGEGSAFDSHTGNTFSINATGLVVIKGIQNAAPISEITNQIAERFDVDHHTAAEHLKERGIQTVLPTLKSFTARSKKHLTELVNGTGAMVPKSISACTSRRSCWLAYY